MTDRTITVGIGLNHGWQSPPGTAAEWRDLLARLDGQADFLTLHDLFGEAVTGFEATLLATHLGPWAHHVALIPGVALNRAEPFHTATGIATLDYITSGRAGLLLQPPGTSGAALGALNGYPPEDRAEEEQDLLDAVEAVRQLWDSWQDDAVIRDKASQRFLDAGRLHPIRFRGRHFSVQGPSITPRPPQGQPPVLALAHDPASLFQAVTAADVIILQPGQVPPGDFLACARWAAAQAGREGLRYILDVAVDFGGKPVLETPALRWTGSAAELAGLAPRWIPEGYDGIRFLPRDPARDLPALIGTVLPAIGPKPRSGNLRSRFGFERPSNRFAA